MRSILDLWGGKVWQHVCGLIASYRRFLEKLMGSKVLFGGPALPADVLGAWELKENMVVMDQGASLNVP